MALVTDPATALQDNTKTPIKLGGTTGLHNRFGILYSLVNGDLDHFNIDLADSYAWTGQHDFSGVSNFDGQLNGNDVVLFRDISPSPDIEHVTRYSHVYAWGTIQNTGVLGVTHNISSVSKASTGVYDITFWHSGFDGVFLVLPYGGAFPPPRAYISNNASFPNSTCKVRTYDNADLAADSTFFIAAIGYKI